MDKSKFSNWMLAIPIVLGIIGLVGYVIYSVFCDTPWVAYLMIGVIVWTAVWIYFSYKYDPDPCYY